MKVERLRLGLVAASAGAALWLLPFLWMIVASLREGVPADIASLTPPPPFSLANFREAWESGPFLVWYANTVLMCGGILFVQIVTVSMAGYAFARIEFPGREWLFSAFLAQLLLIPPLLIEPNLALLARLGLYDTLGGVMAPYFASAFGVFLMRQTFKSIPLAYEEAAMMDGAGTFSIIFRILLPMASPALAAFSIVSVTAHWNEFLWPLMVINDPAKQTLTIGLAAFTRGAEGGKEWGVLAAGTLLVMAPLAVVFVAFQRRFVDSFVFSGVKG